MKKFFLFFLLLIFSFKSFAQTGNLKGIVKDQNNAVIAGAVVSLKINGQPEKKTVTNANGEFSFEGIAFGEYRITATAENFAPQTIAFKISNSEEREIIFNLPIEQSKFVVTAEIGNPINRDLIPQGVNVIREEELRLRVNSFTAQIAREEASVNVQQTSPTIGGIFIRGLAGKNVNVFVDGVRYSNSAQRGGINTFFNLNDANNLGSIEILRGANGSQYGSDSLGGTVSLLTKTPILDGKVHGEFSTGYVSGNRGFSSNALISFGTSKFGGYLNLTGRRVNNIRTAKGLDSHAAVTRFLGLPSNVLGTRLADTSFTQYGGSTRLNFQPSEDSELVFFYQRGQQDGGKRYDQLFGGDGNLRADLRNLMLDFGYLRFSKQNLGFFDSGSFAVSFNSQREERVNQGGQGNPLAAITHQYERNNIFGGNFFLNKNYRQNNFLFGGDFYHEKINSPAFTVNPANNTAVLSRPRVPDEARFVSGGLFIQDAVDFFKERVRLTGALRYGVASYRARSADSPIVNGFRLWEDDSLRVGDFSGRIGTVVRIVDQFRVAFNYSRGFRYPSMTDLGTLGLTGDGFEVDFTSALNLGGTIGTTADMDAISTGLPVSKQRSEISHNYDFSLRYQNKRIETDLTVFRLDINDTITKQSLILPLGAVGRRLGDQTITSQSANGVVFVPLSTSPVLVRANFTSARLFGVEYELEAQLLKDLKFRGNYTYIRSKDVDTGLPPNIEGGLPPPTGFISFRYVKPKYWLELYSNLASRQERLSSLDLADRRTGATRSRTQIANFFRRGACVAGLTNNPDGRCGSGDETILLLTGETLAQVQNRVLGTANSAPLFTALPSYALINFRGSYTFTEKFRLIAAFENIFDRQYRNPSWGVDGMGRSLSFQLRYKF